MNLPVQMCAVKQKQSSAIVSDGSVHEEVRHTS